MAKYSMKRGGKEIGPASVYAPPHTEAKPEPNMSNGYTAKPNGVNELNVSVGNYNTKGYNPAPETEGITMRGYGAATKGIKSRGPMA